MYVCWPEMLVRFNQEAEVAVITEVRGQENFWCLAVHLPEHSEQQKKAAVSQHFRTSYKWSRVVIKKQIQNQVFNKQRNEKHFMIIDIFMP